MYFRFLIEYQKDLFKENHMKKIVLIHTDFKIYQTARIKHFYDSLDKNLYELNVIEISNHGGNYNFDDSKVNPSYWDSLYEDIPITELNTKDIRKKIFYKLNLIKPDYIIAGALAFPSGAISLQYALKYNIPIVIFDDARLEDVPRSFIVNCVKKQLYTCVDAIFCPSDAWNKTYQYFGFSNHELFYGVDVIDNSFFHNNNSNGNELEDTKYFLNLG